MEENSLPRLGNTASDAVELAALADVSRFLARCGVLLVGHRCYDVALGAKGNGPARWLYFVGWSCTSQSHISTRKGLVSTCGELWQEVCLRGREPPRHGGLQIYTLWAGPMQAPAL